MKKRKWILLAACFVLGWLCGSRMDRGGAGETIVRVETVEETAAQVETAGTQPTGETSRTKQTDEAGTEEWNLVLVNRWNPLDSDPEITLTQLRNGQAVDERCYPDLQEMMDACRAAGLSPLICSSYRTMEDQAALYQAKIRDLIQSGSSETEAQTLAGTIVAVPGTSEHQLGLAVDIVDENYQLLDENQENTDVQKWLMEHSWEYGFILRYPSDKSDVTGIIYEPWHYRYVGKEAAKEIYESGLCLEEYLEQT